MVLGHVAELDAARPRSANSPHDAPEVGPVVGLDEVEADHLLDRLGERPVGDQHAARPVGPHRHGLRRRGQRAGGHEAVAAGGEVAVELLVRAHPLLVLLGRQQRPLGLGRGQQHEVTGSRAVLAAYVRRTSTRVTEGGDDLAAVDAGRRGRRSRTW